jgi:hypothetical protein
LAGSTAIIRRLVAALVVANFARPNHWVAVTVYLAAILWALA